MPRKTSFHPPRPQRCLDIQQHPDIVRASLRWAVEWEQANSWRGWWADGGFGEIYYSEKLYNVYIFTWWFKLRSFVEIPFSCFWLVIFSLNVYRQSNPEELSCDQGMHCHGGLHVGKYVWNSEGRVLWTAFFSVSKVYKTLQHQCLD